MSERISDPVPQGKYAPATRAGNIVFTAGMTARKNGVPVMTGKVCPSEPIESYRAAAEQAVENAYTAVSNRLESGEAVLRVLSMTVYINAEEGFTAHSKIADLASEWLFEKIGERGTAARTAIGVFSLPGDAPIEISIVCEVGQPVA